MMAPADDDRNTVTNRSSNVATPRRTGSELQLPPETAQEIARAISGIRFGSVEIVIHDSRVVQIERKEKVRLP
jgi:hypothetical protein